MQQSNAPTPVLVAIIVLLLVGVATAAYFGMSVVPTLAPYAMHVVWGIAAVGVVGVFLMTEAQTLLAKNASGRVAQEMAPFEMVPQAIPADYLQLRGLLTDGEFDQLEAALDAMPHADDKAYGMQTAALWVKPPETLSSWIDAEPSNPLPRMIAARQKIHAAWLARGSGFGHEVGDDSADAFDRLMREAWGELVALRSIASDDANIPAFQLIAARGLQLPLEDHRAVLDEARALDPNHWEAHHNFLLNACEKWHGSHDAMFEFARKSAANAAPGSPLHGLVPFAHAERRLYLDLWEEDEQAKEEYFHREVIMDEIKEAWRNLHAGPAEGFARAGRAGALNAFAFCFSRSDEMKLGAAAFTELNGFFRRFPWWYFGGCEAYVEAEAFCRARA